MPLFSTLSSFARSFTSSSCADWGGETLPEIIRPKGRRQYAVFFGSVRFSEDMDLDVASPDVDRLKGLVGGILSSPAFTDQLRPFGIREIRPPGRPPKPATFSIFTS